MTTPAMPELPDGATVLPDGSAFAIASFPLPSDHWLYAPREYRDGEEEPIELPSPILSHQAHGDVVRAAIRYAVRSATMCGKEPDFDPDALVQNAMYALCGPFGGATLQAQPAEVSDAEIVDALEAEFLGEPGKRNLADDLRVARAILALRPQAESERDLRTRHTNLLLDLHRLAEGDATLCDFDEVNRLEAKIDSLVDQLASLRPQAVPMTEAERAEVFRKAESRMVYDLELSWRDAVVKETEAHYGVTAQGAQGEQA